MSTRFDDVREGAAFFVVLVVRGLALWMLIPLTLAFWLVLSPLRWIVRRTNRPSFRQYVTWVDQTLVALIERGPLRPLVTHPEPLPSWPRERAEPPYRVGILDLW